MKLRRTGHFAKVQNPHCGAHCQWRSAYKRGSTSIRSRSTSLCDSAITRRNACCSITWKTLRRPRKFLRVGQRSKTTVGQRREDHHLQNGQFRTSRRSTVIHQFLKHVVFDIATTGLVEKGRGKRPGNSWRSASSSSSSPASERSDGMAPGNRCDPPKQKTKTEG